MDLETLRTQCLSCTRCPLHTTRTNVVFGPVSYTHLTLPTNREV